MVFWSSLGERFLDFPGSLECAGAECAVLSSGGIGRLFEQLSIYCVRCKCGVFMSVLRASWG